MRVVLLGYQIWGRRSLEALLERPDISVELVVTHPDGDDLYERVWTDSIAEPARAAGIEVVELGEEDGDAALQSLLTAAAPDVVIASNWRSFVPSDVLAVAALGGINVHDAPLPRYGGFAPINWAIARGESEVGLTAHVMSPAIDLGDVIVQETLPIGPDETAREVAERVFERVGPITVAALDHRTTPGFLPTPQPRERSTLFHRRTLADSRIDWSRPAREVHNLVRAQSDPYPNAFTTHDGRRLEVQRTSLPSRAYCGTPGRVACRAGGGVVVICGRDHGEDNQGVILHRVSPEGATPIDAADHFTEMGVDLT
jgi:methionyl-tRNA formyltransferase